MADAEPKRKYDTEWMIGITVLAAVVGRQQDLQRTTLPTHYDCHLYLVTRQPRQTVLPDSVSITDERVAFTLRLQRGESYDKFHLSAPNPFGPGPWVWKSEWPYERFSIERPDGGEVALAGLVAALASSFPDWPGEASRHDVMYVGQAFGQAGERTAWDRLKSHATVQRIMAETPNDQQVWLTFAAISDNNAYSMTDPSRQLVRK